MMYSIIKIQGVEDCIRFDKGNGQILLIPENIENIDYQDYLEWISKGNQPEIIENP